MGRMKYRYVRRDDRVMARIPRLFKGCIALTLLAGASAAQGDFEMHDPVFNLRYDIRKVHFEDAPASISQRCQGEVRPDKYWVFAYWKGQDSEFFVISSLATKLRGLGLVITNEQCIVGSAD